jgi:Clustered mitochondria/Translation initiation factor eIF3 subunit 135
MHLSCGLPELSVPLMALVDFLGCRVVAMSLLPIDKTTLAYGSCDSGRTIHMSARFKRLMRRVGSLLNVSAHRCGTSQVEVYSAVDIEGHHGADGRQYVIDFSRTMPPTRPDRGRCMGHLYQMLRVEFVRAHPVPLCSDAYSGFMRETPDRRVHNRAVSEATKRLLCELVPRAARQMTFVFTEACQLGRLDSFSVSEALHRHGINMRYLGYVMSSVAAPASSHFRLFLLCEAVSRVLKCMLRERLRRQMRALKVPLTAPYLKTICQFLNLAFGSLELAASEALWRGEVLPLLAKLYYIRTPLLDQCVDDDDGSDDDDLAARVRQTILRMALITRDADTTVGNDVGLRASGRLRAMRSSNNSGTGDDNDADVGDDDDDDRDMPLRSVVLCRLAAMTGLLFRDGVLQRVQSGRGFNAYVPFNALDVCDMGVRIKHTNLMTMAEGCYCHASALSGRTGQATAVALIEQAKQHFDEALVAAPNDHHLLLHCAEAYCRGLQFQLVAKHQSSSHFETTQPDTIATECYFLRAIDSWPALDKKGLSHANYHYARFLARCARYVRAEEKFLVALEFDANNANALSAYANFLQEQQEQHVYDEAIDMLHQRVNLVRHMSQQQ